MGDNDRDGLLLPPRTGDNDRDDLLLHPRTGDNDRDDLLLIGDLERAGDLARTGDIERTSRKIKWKCLMLWSLSGYSATFGVEHWNEEISPNSIVFHSWLRMAAANPLPFAPFDFMAVFI